MRPEFGLSVAMARDEALSVVSTWDVCWCPDGAEETARLLLFPQVEIMSRVRRPVYRTVPLNLSRPVKLLHDGAVASFEAALGTERSSQSNELRRERVGAADGWFSVVPRAGVLDVADDVQASSPVRPYEEPPTFYSEVRERAVNLDIGQHSRMRNESLAEAVRVLEDTAYCVAFVPFTGDWGNSLTAADPWHSLLRSVGQAT